MRRHRPMGNSEADTMVTPWFPIAAVVFTILDVTLSAKPEFDHPPSFPSLPILKGSPMTLECFVRSGVNFTMTWRKNNRTIEKSPHVIFKNENQTLLIRKTVLRDKGVYDCRASNEDGSVEYKQFMKIRDGWISPPVVTDTFPPVGVAKVRLGASVNISCTFSSGDGCFLVLHPNQKEIKISCINRILVSRRTSEYFGFYKEQQTMDWLKDGRYVNETERITFLPEDSCDDGRQTLGLSIVNVTREDLGTYRCYGENQLANGSREITLTEIIPPSDSHLARTKLIVLIATCGGLLVLMVAIAVACRIYRHKSKAYEHLKWEEPDLRNFEIPNHELEYDAFISYSSDDVEWVKEILFKRLRKAGYNICVDFKDFTPGMPIAENIMDAIYKSKRTLIVMSEQFLKSMWGQFELQQAHNRAVAKREDVIILLKLDNCKVPGKLMGKTFLDWADLKVKPHFWQRLKDAIGRPGDFPEPQPIEVHHENEEEPIEKADEKEDIANETNLVIEPEEKLVETDKDLSEDPPDKKPEVKLIDPKLANVDQHGFIKAKACRLQ